MEVEEVRRDEGVIRASLRVGTSSSLSLGTGVFSRKKKAVNSLYSLHKTM